MNYLRRRLSDSSFVANLPNGYMMDLQRPDGPATVPPPSQQGSTAGPGPVSSSSASSFLSSFSSVVKPSQNNQSPAPVATAPPTLVPLMMGINGNCGNVSIIALFKACCSVLQAEFSEINLASYVIGGCMIDMQLTRGGTKVVRSFKPDFVLIRQHAYSMTPGDDFRSLVIGLQYGGVPGVNSLFSIYNFCSKPWVFSQMIKLFHALGPEKFPLNEQTFYPSHKQMVSSLCLLL
uniref:Synapsin III n=1 Tax=Paramormyrops kingsleyae TaxID=1676925 RepID=A0A3B3RF29_9TELE